MRASCLGWITWIALLSTTTAQGGGEEGWARTKPWSGYWWPRASGHIFGPLGKYDRLTGKASVQWERQNYPPGSNMPSWAGFCHGWASAAVLDKEPNQARNVTGPASRQPIILGVGDQKGLLSASHTQDVSNTFGDRYGDGMGSEDMHDMAPDVLWRLLKLYVKDQGTSLILDIEPNDEVWNHPVYGYRIQYSPQGAAGEQLARLELWLADDWVPPDYVGIKVRYQMHMFTFRLVNGSVVMGSARWVGPSVQAHPDFAWYPYVVRPENPEISYASVKQIVGISGDGPPSQPPGPGATSNAPPGVTPSQPSGRPPPPGPGQPLASMPPPPNPLPSPAFSGPERPTPDQTGQPLQRPGAPLTPGQPPPPQTAGPSGGDDPNTTPISPWQLVALIAEKSSAFDLDVTVDRFDGGHYTPEETVTVSGSSAKPGHLYLLAINSQGEIGLLHPQLDVDNRIPGQQRFVFPEPEVGYLLEDQPPGTMRIKALVTSRPLLLSGLDWTEEPAAPKASPGGKRRWQKFRWPPTEHRQLTERLVQYQQQQKLEAVDPGEVDPALILGEFAQDEVAFYVGPREGGQPGPDQSNLDPRRD